MKKTLIAAAVVGLGLLAAPASAADHMPPGKTIQDSCGTSFGQLVGPAKAAGDSAHPNYAGGANAFVGVAVVHGCAG